MRLYDLLKEYAPPISPLDAEILAAHILKKSREHIAAHGDTLLSARDETGLRALLLRRAAGEPIAYLIGYKAFYGRKFFVDERVLIPRPETETLIDAVFPRIRALPPTARVAVCDIGTGSGCIATTIAAEITRREKNTARFSFIASDVSRDALSVAKKNIRAHGMEKHIQVIHSNLFEKLFSKKALPICDAVFFLANLPYITTDEMKRAGVKEETRGTLFEPHSALVAGGDGLSLYRELIAQTERWHKRFPHQAIYNFYEIAPTQKDSLEKIILPTFPDDQPTFLRDLSGKIRVCLFKIRS